MAGQAKSSETRLGRKLAVGALTAAGALLGTGLPAAADGCRAYPPVTVLDSESVALSDTRPEPGAVVTVAVSDCLVGDRVDVIFGDEQLVGTCVASGSAASGGNAAALGAAAFEITAPAVTGVYVGTVAMYDGSVCGTFDLEVTGGVLPQQPDKPQSPGGGTPTVQPPAGVLPATGTNVVPLLLSTSLAALATGGALLFGARLRRSRAS